MNGVPFLLTRAHTRAILARMASGPECVERFEREGLFVASPALTARRIREKAPDLWPPAGKGGGRKSPQVEPRHLTNFILAQAAHLPIDAADAVTALRDVRMTEQEVLRSEKYAPVLGAIAVFGHMDQSLGDALDIQIAGMADPVLRKVAPSVTGHDWALTLCADPAFATASYRLGHEIFTDVFGNRAFSDRARRLITLPFRVILIAGELCETRNAARPGAALPTDRSHSASREARSLHQPNSMLRVRVSSTPPNGDRHASPTAAPHPAAMG
jgi:hypothetical protein